MTEPSSRASSRFFERITSDDETLRRLLPFASVAELDAIRRLAQPVALDLEEWSCQWPAIDPSTIVPITLINVVDLHELPVSSIALRARETLWTFALDDLLDRTGAAADPPTEVLTECLAVACATDAASPCSELARCLDNIRRDLAQYPQFPRLHPVWAASLSRVFDGMMYEYWVARREEILSPVRSLPSLLEYLFFSHSSIALTHVWMTGLIVGPDEIEWSILTKLYLLAEQCGVAMRLANDWSTFSRERIEGRVNAVTIEAANLSGYTGEPNEDVVHQARGRLAAMAREEQRKAEDIAASLQPANSVSKRFVRTTQFGVELYLRGDFRGWVDQIAERNGGTS